MLMSTGFQIIEIMFEQPQGWLGASLPKIEKTNKAIKKIMSAGSTSLDEASEQIKEEYWYRLTDVTPTQTHFSVVIPIHNEQRSLPSFMGALLHSEIPAIADVLFIFVLNASSDKSLTILKNRLSLVGTLNEINLPPSKYDQKRKAAAYQVQHKNIRLLLIQTETPGKSNALNIGNEIALQQGHDIALCIDANNWVEPDAIALQYACAKQMHIDNPDSEVVIVNSNEFAPIRGTQENTPSRDKTQKAEVTGWMFSWSTKWIDSKSGFSKKVIEDYALGLLALSQGKKIATSRANIWGYSAANRIDENSEYYRYTFGAMQLAQHHKNDLVATQILLDDFPNLRPLNERIKYHIFSRANKKMPIKSLLRRFFNWILNEFFILKARYQLHNSPQKETWKPIQSTK